MVWYAVALPHYDRRVRRSRVRDFDLAMHAILFVGTGGLWLLIFPLILLVEKFQQTVVDPLERGVGAAVRFVITAPFRVVAALWRAARR